jgi:hypothetical protein
MLGYAGLCGAMRGYAGLCEAMRGYAGLCRAMRGYAGLGGLGGDYYKNNRKDKAKTKSLEPYELAGKKEQFD